MDNVLRRSRSALRTSAGLFAVGTIAFAQFKEVGPAPFPPAEAHQKIRMLLDQVDPANQRQTTRTIVGWLPWYRDVTDDELIASWKGDNRVGLNLVVDELGDARVAAEIVKSWRQPGLNPAAAPILTKLMSRFSDSAAPFLHDVLQRPDLSEPEAETVCRVLLDLPDQWRGSALQVLPHYRGAAQGLLAQDLRDSDTEKVGRAQFWLRDLRWNVPGDGGGPDISRQYPRRSRPAPISSDDLQSDDRPVPRRAISSDDLPSSRPDISRPAQSDARPMPPPQALPPVAPPLTYSGPRSGTLTCNSLVPQNAEAVFRNLPRGELKLDYDTKNWKARLVPGGGETQRLILTNVGSGPQKKCEVHWSAIR